MASNTKSSNNHDSRPDLKQSNSNNQTHNQQKQKPLTPASSLPSKPSFPKKTSGWAAIAAAKNQDNASAASSNSSTSGSTSSTQRKPNRQNSSTGNQRSNKKSSSPKLTEPGTSDVAPKKTHTPLNNFNSKDIAEYLNKRTEELSLNYPIINYKISGSEWSKLGTKHQRKNEKDVVMTELSKFLSKN